MKITPDEQEFLLFLGKRFLEQPYSFITDSELLEALGIEQGRLDTIQTTFIGCDIFESSSGGIRPLRGALEHAREIEAQREQAAEPPDLVEKVTQWARRRPVPATLIVIAQVLATLIGLVGGILGAIAFFR